MKRFLVVAALLMASAFAAAQKADAAFVIGGSFVSDTNGTVIIPPPFVGTANVTIKTDHHVFFEEHWAYACWTQKRFHCISRCQSRQLLPQH